jgi:hypothetical protein
MIWGCMGQVQRRALLSIEVAGFALSCDVREAYRAGSASNFARHPALQK